MIKNEERSEETDEKLVLAVTDALCYAHTATTKVYRDIELSGLADGVLRAAGRGDEVEHKRALRANALIVQTFLTALADYGYAVVAARAGEVL